VSWLSSLFRNKTLPKGLWTGRVLSADEFRNQLDASSRGCDETYAVVNSAALSDYYSWYRRKLHDLGLTHWDTRADCDDFANLYADLFNLRLYLGQWERENLPNAQGVAVARIHYRPDNQIVGHAINAISTDKGLLYIEPQTGQFVTLSDSEELARFNIIF
jgi:hypothetical protein